MKQGQQMSDGKATPQRLVAGLAEVCAEFRRVGHRDPRAIDMKDPMPTPTSVVVDPGSEPLGDPNQEFLEEFPGQAGAGLAVGRSREAEPAETRKMLDRGVAVQDLEQEQMNRGDGVQERATPGVSDLAAEVEDGGSVEFSGRVLLQAAKDAHNPVMHREVSCMGCR